jgi:hypothetical protein
MTRVTPTKLLAGSQALQIFIPEICSALDKLVEAVQARLQVAFREINNIRENPGTDKPGEDASMHTEAQHIQDAYQTWLGRYEEMEGENKEQRGTVETYRQKVFAEQVGYVCFARLLLARVLEDKGMMPRVVSDGGLQCWSEFLYISSLESPAEIWRGTCLPLIYQHVRGFCCHFFQQPVFDWFRPDDSLLAPILSRLKRYNFKDVSNDLLGFTYEAFIERVARNQKGHFLTPPRVVEFMLDRAGYTSRAIIDESVLDMSCGSGSFLVHAARRLRNVMQSSMSTASPVERARTFIDQVQTKLVGMEINPFSCYLAELNLFIQVLDDLALLWNKGEQPKIERFAIYNTNSLEMPDTILHSEHKATATTAFDDGPTVLDEAASVKAMQKAFPYIVCNPPYVNRGIVRGAKSYGEFPFYREVVKGDENFYLLFLRLATYYIAPGGTICFICPLNLLGDESTMRAREIFNRTEDWSLRSITRFYTRTVLFPGVLQGVCVIRIDQQPALPTDTIEIRGGLSIQEAEQSNTPIQYARITSNYPARTTWSKPWLIHTNPVVYDLWEFIQQHMRQDLADLIAGKLRIAKGDVRSTWTKPLKVTAAGTRTVPMTKGEKIDDWGDWSLEAYLDPSLTIPSTVKYYKSSLWVQKNIQRITGLTQTETVLLLKEVSGLEAKRPIRGTLIQRNASHPVVADETLVVMYTLDGAYENLASAIFGLITSSLYNFLFSLFSTNAHANLTEFLRLPIPVWTAELEKRLAASTKAVFHTYKQLYDHKRLYGTNQNQRVGVTATLAASGLPTIRLEELVLRSDLTLDGPTTHNLETLLEHGQITFATQINSEARTAIKRIIQANNGLSYSRGGKELLVPNPRVAMTFLTQLEQREGEREKHLLQASEQQQELDEQIIEAYGIHTPVWRSLIIEGVPWAKG